MVKTIKQHEKEWFGCTRCGLGSKAKRHVLFQRLGTGPIDLLIVGEAPGEEEDKTGIPFIGRSGLLLRGLINEFKDGQTIVIANTVACRPVDDSGTNRPPTEDETRTCSPRLQDLIGLLKPKKILALGRSAQNWFEIYWEPNGIIHGWHPAYVLRQGGKGSKAYDELREAIKEALA